MPSEKDPFVIPWLVEFLRDISSLLLFNPTIVLYYFITVTVSISIIKIYNIIESILVPGPKDYTSRQRLLTDVEIVLLILWLGYYLFSLLVKVWTHSFRFFQYSSAGLTTERIHQLHLLENSQSSSYYFIDEIWFDIVACVAEPQDWLRSRHKDYPWLWDFISPNTQSKSGQLSLEELQDARSNFDLNPEDFIKRLQSFSEDLRISDVSTQIVLYCASQEHGEHCSQVRLECWMALQDRIRSVTEGPRSPGATTTSTDDSTQKALKFVRDCMGNPHFSAAARDQLEGFLEQSTHKEKEEVSIATSWKLERHRSLLAIFETWNADVGSRLTLQNISEQVKRLSQSQWPLSVVHQQFQLKVCSFVEMITRKRDRSYADALDSLSGIAAQRSKQWETLYKAIEKYRSQIAEQEKIIICLEYRHVLENLPNMTSLGKRFSANDLSNNTKTWECTWTLAVTDELEHMIDEFINAANNITTVARRPRPFRELLQFKFDVWTRKNRRTILGTTSPANTSLVQTHNPPFQDWPCFTRGKAMYSELSANIHGYGKSYDVPMANWLKSDKIILDWLKPQVDVHTKEVDWANEWGSRGLPH